MTYIAGIRINEAFDDISRVDIAPYFVGSISHASAKHVTPFGEVKVSWQRTAEKRSFYLRRYRKVCTAFYGCMTAGRVKIRLCKSEAIGLF